MDYLVNDSVVTGTVVITEDTEISAVPQSGFYFESNITTNWTFVYTEI